MVSSTAALAQYLRDTWSYDGLEVKATSSETVVAALGPSFPISELCMDIGNPDKFDATICSKVEQGNLTLIIKPGDLPRPPSHLAWMMLPLFLLGGLGCFFHAPEHLRSYRDWTQLGL